MTIQRTTADRVAQALEILAEVSHNAESSAALRGDAEQVRFDLLEALAAFRANRTPEGSDGLRAVLRESWQSTTPA
jgi:hypothetical protein